MTNVYYAYRKEIEEKSREIISSLTKHPILPGMEKETIASINQKAFKLSYYLIDRKHRMNEPCTLCYNKYARDYIFGIYYDTPFDDKGEERHFCSQKCQDIYENEGDFRYYFCDYCHRLICEQNPSNGWHVQFREYLDNYICLRCYEECILENGIPREDFKKKSIPGMFFSYGNTELVKAGYKEVPGFVEYFIGDTRRFCKKAIELIDKGYKIVVAYEQIAIGGLEGMVTMYSKKGE